MVKCEDQIAKNKNASKKQKFQLETHFRISVMFNNAINTRPIRLVSIQLKITQVITINSFILLFMEHLIIMVQKKKRNV